MRIYVDGSGWNGRRSRYAVVAEGGKTASTAAIKEFEEHKTSNQMEYAALIEALKLARDGDEILTDSQLLVGQVSKGWKVNKAHLVPLVDECKRLRKSKRVKLEWVPREMNKAGKLLERQR